MRIFSQPKFLATYSGVLPLTSALTVYFGILHPVHGVDFDLTRAHRIEAK